MIRIGLISDTHGLLRPQALASLQVAITSCMQATSVIRPLLERLATLAPVTAVRGNNDSGWLG